MNRILILVLLVLATTARADFFVDFAGGNDANVRANSPQGNSLENAAGFDDHFPGSGFLNTAWGSITSGNKIPAGSIIHIKSGGTYNGAIGGRVLMDNTYYSASATAANPITVFRDTTWGSGPVLIDGNAMRVAGFHAVVEIWAARIHF